MMIEPGDDVAVEPQEHIQVESSTHQAPEPKPESEEETHEGESEEQRSERKKGRGGFQRKLERKDAEIARLQQELAARAVAPKQDSSPKSDAPIKPKLDDFKTYQDYDEAKDDYYEKLADYTADQKVKSAFDNRDKQSQEAKQRQAFDEKANKYKEQVEQARKVHPDFDDVINSYDDELSPAMQAALLDSDMGAQVSYYLAKNPEEADALQGMGIIALNKAIAKIEAKLESSSGAAVKTKSPPPLNPIRNSAKTGSKDPSEMSDAEYERWRYPNRK